MRRFEHDPRNDLVPERVGRGGLDGFVPAGRAEAPDAGARRGLLRGVGGGGLLLQSREERPEVVAATCERGVRI